MGRKGNWFSAMKKALNPDSKEQSSQEPGKSKKKWFRKKKKSDLNCKPSETVSTTTTSTTTTLPPQPVVGPVTAAPEQAKVSEVEKEQTKHAYNVAVATAKAAEAAVAAAEAAAEVVRLTSTFPGKSKEELAAIKIQTAFRGYMARRTLRALRGLMRLKTVMQGHAIKRQTTNTLKSMQTLARMQSQIRERRLRMAEENQDRQRQLQLKYAKEQEKELEKLQQSGDNWDSSIKTKEQIEAKMQSKHEAAIRRERTLAYAYTHQQPWKASSRSASTMFMDPNNPHWGWSWLERWLAARPWETATMSDKESSNENSPRVIIKAPKGGTSEITKLSHACLHNAEKPSPTSAPKQPRSSTAGRLSTSSAPPSKTGSSSGAQAQMLRSPSPKASPKEAAMRMSVWGPDDDSRSMLSVQSEQSRRNSTVGESSVRDDESLASSQTVPSYMVPTESAKAKLRLGGELKVNNRSITPERLSVSSAKKRLSYPASPARSRRSTSSAADATSVSEHHT